MRAVAVTREGDGPEVLLVHGGASPEKQAHDRAPGCRFLRRLAALRAIARGPAAGP